MKKLLALLFTGILLLAGCGASGDTASADIDTEITEAVEIEFWHGLTGVPAEELERLTAKFNESQDKITVVLAGQGSYSDLNTKLTAAGNAKELPVLAMGYPDAIYGYNQSGYIEDLLPYIENETIGLDAANYVSTYYNEVTMDGKQTALPFNKSTELLFYNETALKDLGMEVPTSWDEVVAVSKAYYEKTGKPGFGMDAPANLMSVAISECGIDSWVKDDKIAFNDECVANRITEYQTAKNEGWFRLPGEDKYMSGPFGNEDVLMYVGSSAGASYIESGVNGKFDWSVAAVPGEIATQQGTSLMVFNTASAQEKLAGYEYIKFMTNDENTVDWAIATGYLPVTLKGLESTTYQDFAKTNATALAAEGQIDKMKVVVGVFPGSQEIYNVLFNEFVTSTVQGGSDVKAGLDKLETDAQAIYDMNK